jgi:hypothetical protein
MIERLRQRFVEESFELALHGKKQTRFKAKTFDGRVEAQLIALRCSAPPAGQQHWSLRLLAETLREQEVVAAISHETVRQLLKKRTQAVDSERMVDSECRRRVRLCDGSGVGCVRASLS